MRRIVSLWLPHFPVERLARARRKMNAPPPPEAAPFALVSTGAKGLTLVAVNEAAAWSGLVPGLRLADARARVPDLSSELHEPVQDAASLLSLARWMERWTPSVSLDPPLIVLAPAKTSTSWPKLRDSGSFCINILAASQKPVCDLFARSGIDKFAELSWRPGVTGSPVLAGVLAYIDCDLEAEHDAGDHTIAVGRVRDLEILDPGGAPLLFFRGQYGQFEGMK